MFNFFIISIIASLKEFVFIVCWPFVIRYNINEEKYMVSRIFEETCMTIEVLRISPDVYAREVYAKLGSDVDDENDA